MAAAALPLELVLHIVRLAIEDSPPASIESYDILRRFSLTSQAWARFAQEELFRHVRLPCRLSLLNSSTASSFAERG